MWFLTCTAIHSILISCSTVPFVFKPKEKGTVVGKKTMGIVQILITLILPPLAVAIYKGFGKDFWINLLLTLILWLPGVIHGLYVQSR